MKLGHVRTNTLSYERWKKTGREQNFVCGTWIEEYVCNLWFSPICANFHPMQYAKPSKIKDQYRWRAFYLKQLIQREVYTSSPERMETLAIGKRLARELGNAYRMMHFAMGIIAGVLLFGSLTSIANTNTVDHFVANFQARHKPVPCQSISHGNCQITDFQPSLAENADASNDIFYSQSGGIVNADDTV